MRKEEGGRSLVISVLLNSVVKFLNCNKFVTLFACLFVCLNWFINWIIKKHNQLINSC